MYINNPLERMVVSALKRADIRYVYEPKVEGSTRRLDFFLPDRHLFIEVKKAHSPRSAAQLEAANNVILLQGKLAVAMFCGLIDASLWRWLASLVLGGPLAAQTSTLSSHS